MGIVTIAYNPGIYSLRFWSSNEHSLSNPLHLVTPCYVGNSLRLKCYFLVPISFSIAILLWFHSVCAVFSFFFYLVQLSVCVWVYFKCFVVANAFLSIPFNSHSNYAALIRFTKVETFQQPFQFSAHISNIGTIFRINVHTFWWNEYVALSLARSLNPTSWHIILIHSKFNPYPVCFSLACAQPEFSESNRQHIYRTQLCILAYIFYLI